MDTTPEGKATKGKETRLFVFLVVCLFPILSVALVGGYGLIIWFMQMLLGPPGPPTCLLYTSPSPRDRTRSRMPSSA